MAVQNSPIQAKECGTNASYNRGCRCAPCKDARKAYSRAWRAKNPTKQAAYDARAARKRASLFQMVQDIKVAEGCKDCGYNASPYALAFDHLPEHTKEQDISQMVRDRPNITKLFDEIAKCEVVCHNCHAVRTHVTRKVG